jgi:peptide/nickel transport system substrate-binding protein
MGAKSREAPTNLKPVGTGPYKFVDFKPGDMVRGEINAGYHQPTARTSTAIEMKGGGDAVGGARAVLQTGEYDYAWNLQVEDEILKRWRAAARARCRSSRRQHRVHPAQLHRPLDRGRRRARQRQEQAPGLQDKAVREAMGLLIDRKGVQDFIYGRTGIATANFLNNPPRFAAPNTKFEFNVDKANQILEAAGWKKGADGIRAKGQRQAEVRLPDLDQPAAPEDPGHHQAGLRQGRHRPRAQVVTAAVFFSSDFANPDTYQKFWSDMQMYTTTMTQPDPQVFMEQFCHVGIAQKANKWQGRNISRWRSRRSTTTRTRRRGRARPGQARRDVHQDERPRGRNRPCPGAVRPATSPRLQQQARRPDQRLGQQHLRS